MLLFDNRTIRDEIKLIADCDTFIESWFLALGFIVTRICDIVFSIAVICIFLFVGLLLIVIAIEVTYKHFIFMIPIYIFGAILSVIVYYIRKTRKNF